MQFADPTYVPRGAWLLAVLACVGCGHEHGESSSESTVAVTGSESSAPSVPAETSTSGATSTPAPTGEPAPTGDNLLENPSFEAGIEPWYTPVVEGEIWRAPDHEDSGTHGEHSIRLLLDSREFGDREYGVFGPSQGAVGLRQDLELEGLPRFFRGKYRLTKWERRTPAQCFEVVFGVSNADNLGLFRKRDVEIAFVLGGVDLPPVVNRLRRFRFVGPKEPDELVGEWREFAIDLHEAFIEEWGAAASSFDASWVTIESRFDSKVDHRTGHLETELWFDELYLGD